MYSRRIPNQHHLETPFCKVDIYHIELWVGGRHRDNQNDYFCTNLQDNIVCHLSSRTPSCTFLCSDTLRMWLQYCVYHSNRWKCPQMSAAQLHVGCVGGCVCSQSGLALELLSTYSITILRVNHSNPLQPMFRPLLHPVHKVVNKGITWSFAGKLHWYPWPYKLSPRLLQLDIWVDPCRKKDKMNATVTEYMVPHFWYLVSPYL